MKRIGRWWRRYGQFGVAAAVFWMKGIGQWLRRYGPVVVAVSVFWVAVGWQMAENVEGFRVNVGGFIDKCMRLLGFGFLAAIAARLVLALCVSVWSVCGRVWDSVVRRDEAGTDDGPRRVTGRIDRSWRTVMTVMVAEALALNWQLLSGGRDMTVRGILIDETLKAAFLLVVWFLVVEVVSGVRRHRRQRQVAAGREQHVDELAEASTSVEAKQ